MSWPHFGLTTFALVSLLLVSQGRAQAQLIHEHADWPALTSTTSPCKSLPFTVTGPGRLTIRLKMNPYYRRTFTNRGEYVVQAEALPYIATGKGSTINGIPGGDDTPWFGKPVDQISTWEFGGGKRSAEVVFCPAVMCSGSGCSQRAATAELIVDWTAGNTGVKPAKETAGAAWIGTWKTNFGTFVVTEVGGRLTGTYSHDKGRVTGTATAELFTGTWAEEPTYNGPKDAGNFDLRLSNDGQSFKGNYRYKNTQSGWDGPWNGTKMR